MAYTFRQIIKSLKALILPSAFIALAATVSCAPKKSAIEQLIVQKPDTQSTHEEKSAKQILNKETLTKEELKISPAPPHAEDTNKAKTIQKKPITGPTVKNAQGSFSQAITELTEKSTQVLKDEKILPEDSKSGKLTSKTTSPDAIKPKTIPEPSLPKKIKTEEDVSLNFEEADIKDIIITFCELLKVDYILDPGISGKITLQTFNKVKVKDLFHILEKILVLNKLTVIKTGSFYRFMPIESAKKESQDIYVGKNSKLIPSRDRLITQIIPLDHVSTTTVKSIIAPLLTKHSTFLDIPGANTLMLIDTANNIKRLLEIINIVDVSNIDSLQIKIFPLEYSDAVQFAFEIKEIFNALGYTAQGPSRAPSKNIFKTSQSKAKGPAKRPVRTATRATRPRSSAFSRLHSRETSTINFIPITRINSLLVVNPFPEILPDIKFWISKLDKKTKVFIGKDRTKLTPQDGQIIQILPLNYLLADSLKGIVTPLLSEQGQLLNVPNKNNLIIMDNANNIKRILEIVNLLDINTLDELDIKLFPLEYSDVYEIAEEIKEIFDSLGYTAKDKALILKFVPIERLNSLLIVSHIPELLPDIEFWISKLDTPSFEGLEERTYIYYVQNAKAADLADLLNQLYGGIKKKEGKEQGKKRASKDKTEFKKEEIGTEKPTRHVEVKSIQKGEITGKILVIPDTFTNALIIHTLPKNYPAILDTIKYLDLMPLQVLIEVLVVELDIDEQTKAGLDWAFKEGKFAVGSVPSLSDLSVGTALGATAILSHGFSFLAQTGEITALFQAFADDSKLNVLSNPILITSENMPASINITDEIPIETTITTPSTGGAVIQTTEVQYKSVGIKLEITPLINKDRYVNLQISQEISNVNEAASFTQPAFFTRSTQTNVVVKDKQTLVIGGLMSKTKSNIDSGIPYLKKIPLFGYLFKLETNRVRKNELMIFITPHVIANTSEAASVTKTFRSKLINLAPKIRLKDK